jgi:rare lipoprotein A
MSFVKLVAFALLLVTLGACAPSAFTNNKSDLVTTERRAVSNNNRAASVVRIHRAPANKDAAAPHGAAGPGPSIGVASFYDDAGSQTANGETFDPNKLTAAHPTLPFGTRLRVTNVANGRSVVVRINDRGPFVAGRAVDVSVSAAETLGMTERGTAKVKLDVVR